MSDTMDKYMKKFGMDYSNLMHIEGGMDVVCKECGHPFGTHFDARCP